MNATQKLARMELLISLTAILGALFVFPWLGDRAMGMFGVLGFLGLTPLFLMKRKGKVVTDERDQNIQLRAQLLGFGAAWMSLVLTLVALTAFVNLDVANVPKSTLSFALWVSFALCYAVKGGATLFMYRPSNHAA